MIVLVGLVLLIIALVVFGIADAVAWGLDDSTKERR